MLVQCERIGIDCVHCFPFRCPNAIQNCVRHNEITAVNWQCHQTNTHWMYYMFFVLFGRFFASLHSNLPSCMVELCTRASHNSEHILFISQSLVSNTFRCCQIHTHTRARTHKLQWNNTTTKKCPQNRIAHKRRKRKKNKIKWTNVEQEIISSSTERSNRGREWNRNDSTGKWINSPCCNPIYYFKCNVMRSSSARNVLICDIE